MQYNAKRCLGYLGRRWHHMNLALPAGGMTPHSPGAGMAVKSNSHFKLRYENCIRAMFSSPSLLHVAAQ